VSNSHGEQLNQTIPAASRWGGWYRARTADPWRCLLSSDDWSRCWDMLLAATRSLPPGELLVSDKNPNRRS
jgi:hypothetical protein